MNLRSSRLVLALASLLLAAVGCTAAETTPPPASTRKEAIVGCPLGVAGAKVGVEEVPDGIVLRFTSTDKAKEMRERANDAAAQHGPGQGMGLGHDGRHGDGAAHGLQLMQAPPSRSVATDIEGGASIHFVPSADTDKIELRAKLRERAAAMNAMACK
jgi:hypothetical protein